MKKLLSLLLSATILISGLLFITSCDISAETPNENDGEKSELMKESDTPKATEKETDPIPEPPTTLELLENIVVHDKWMIITSSGTPINKISCTTIKKWIPEIEVFLEREDCAEVILTVYETKAYLDFRKLKYDPPNPSVDEYINDNTQHFIWIIINSKEMQAKFTEEQAQRYEELKEIRYSQATE